MSRKSETKVIGLHSLEDRCQLVSLTSQLNFQRRLLNWARREGSLRTFPWRLESDPYRFLIAEMMLRRTQAPQVARVYSQFMRNWPTLKEFVFADSQLIRRVLHPLGLEWRVENFLAVQKCLSRSGKVPSSYAQLLELPGVGDYVASAVCCFGYGERFALIDTNSVRVIGRYFQLETGPETRRRKWFKALAHDLVPASDVATYNYALLDLASSVCRPQSPACGACCLSTGCKHARSRQKAP
jgi:A/G-specific adenine glycosylase